MAAFDLLLNLDIRAVRGRGAATAPQSAITALAVLGPTLLPDGSDAALANGWVARATLPDDGVSSFDPTRIVLTVSDPGFDAVGTTIVTRTIRGGAIVRRQYPNQAQRLNSASGGVRTVYFSLDDEIYAGSTISAVNAEAGYYGAAAAGAVSGVSNASTLAYPKPLFAWLNTQHERATGSGFAVEAVAYHRHGRNGRMVARIAFDAKDSQATPNAAATQVVTATALSAIQTQGPIVEAWKANIPLAALAQGDLCFVNARVYPWIGDAGAVLDLAVDGVATGGAIATASPQTPLRFVCDRTGGYGGAFAYVKAGASGGVVSATAATARATPFATIAAALAGIRSFNNASKGHNDHSGGIVRLMDDGAGGVVTHPAGDHDAVAAGKCWTVIEADPANGAAVSVGVATNYPADLLMWKVALVQTGRLDGQNVAGFRTAFVGNSVATNGSAIPINYRVAYSYYQNVTFTGDISAASPFSPFGVVKCAIPLCLGMIAEEAAGEWIAYPYAMIGCRFARGYFGAHVLASNPNLESQDAGVIANNRLMQTRMSSSLGNQPVTRGMAVVQNVIERAAAPTAQPAMQIFGDGAALAAANILIAYNSVPGVDLSGRVNNFYADTAAAAGVQSHGCMRFNIFGQYNVKSDSFTANTTVTGRTGNWRVRYQVGFSGNVDLRGGSDGTTAADGGGASWLGEVLAPNSAHNQTAIGFIDDKSGASGAGGGDYRLTGGANPAFARVGPGLAMLAFDLTGNARRNDGGGAAGAFERS